LVLVIVLVIFVLILVLHLNFLVLHILFLLLVLLLFLLLAPAILILILILRWMCAPNKRTKAASRYRELIKAKVPNKINTKVRLICQLSSYQYLEGLIYVPNRLLIVIV
jgi:hypothetical protein